jgi:hypothetical protein
MSLDEGEFTEGYELDRKWRPGHVRSRANRTEPTPEWTPENVTIAHISFPAATSVVKSAIDKKTR